jgi:hypothetical protein
MAPHAHRSSRSSIVIHDAVGKQEGAMGLEYPSPCIAEMGQEPGTKSLIMVMPLLSVFVGSAELHYRRYREFL